MGLLSFGIGFCSGYVIRNTNYGSQIGNKLFAAYKLLKNATVQDYKLVLVVRDDLKMGYGKIAAQCSHASVMAYKNATLYNPEAARLWDAYAQAKIVLKTSSEKSLIELYESAKKFGLPASLVCDSGRTEIAPGTKTVIAVGPGTCLGQCDRSGVGNPLHECHLWHPEQFSVSVCTTSQISQFLSKVDNFEMEHIF